MSFPFAIVGFDLDGTLVDSSIELSASLNHALGHAGYPPIDPAEVKSLVGMGARVMLERGLANQGIVDPGLVKRLFPVFLEHYEANLGSDCTVFPGLLDALDTLAEKGVQSAVVTNKFESLAVQLLDTIGLSHRFATIIGGDTMGKGSGKPAPDPIFEMIARCGGGRAAFVGDASPDVMASKAAGIPCVAVSFGFLAHPVEELGADAVIDHFDALVPTLYTLG